MDLLQLLILIVIAGICGAIAEWIVGFKPGGLLVSIIVGVIGAYLGGWIGSLLPFDTSWAELEVGAVPINLFWSILGSIILLLLLYSLRGGGRRSLFGRRF